jgi:hypothetical protein
VKSTEISAPSIRIVDKGPDNLEIENALTLLVFTSIIPGAVEREAVNLASLNHNENPIAEKAGEEGAPSQNLDFFNLPTIQGPALFWPKNC